jgi:hypothetical protein
MVEQLNLLLQVREELITLRVIAESAAAARGINVPERSEAVCADLRAESRRLREM